MGSVLKEMKSIGNTVAEKVKAYNDANRKVAILCNHKRTVTAGHGSQMEKLGDRVSSSRGIVVVWSVADWYADQGHALSEMEAQANDASLGLGPQEKEGRGLLCAG